METRRSSPIRPKVSRSGPPAGGSVSGGVQGEAASIPDQITRIGPSCGTARGATRDPSAGVHNGPVEQAFRAAVVTVSDGVSAGTRQDESGQVAEKLLRASGYEILSRSVVPD